MAQEIKKVRIFKENLPELTTKDSFVGYRLRYRIISEDRNQTSAWSPIYEISANDITVVDGTPYTLSVLPLLNESSIRTSTKISLSWTPRIDLKFYSFDVHVKTNIDADYVFYRTVNTTSYDIILPAEIIGNETQIVSSDIIVQISTSDQKLNRNIILFEITDIDLTTAI